jgi:hypothetical protein
MAFQRLLNNAQLRLKRLKNLLKLIGTRLKTKMTTKILLWAQAKLTIWILELLLDGAKMLKYQLKKYSLKL